MITRKMKTIAMLGMIGTFCLSIGILGVKAGTEIILVDVKGQVEVRSQQVIAWKTVGNGAVLQYGDVIRTGSKSKAEIHFQAGTIRMYENTILELPSKPNQLKVSEDSTQIKTVLLRKGRSLFQVFKNRLNGSFEVVTPSLIAGVKGTTFRVTEEKGLKGVTVFEGIVQVTNRERPEERIDVTSQHFTILSEDHLIPSREFQEENFFQKENTVTPEERFEEKKIKTRLEERITDLVEKNRELQAEVIGNSVRIDTSSTKTHTLSTSSTQDTTLLDPNRTLSSTTETLTGTASDTQNTLSDTTGTLTGTITDIGSGLLTLP